MAITAGTWVTETAITDVMPEHILAEVCDDTEPYSFSDSETELRIDRTIVNIESLFKGRMAGRYATAITASPMISSPIVTHYLAVIVVHSVFSRRIHGGDMLRTQYQDAIIWLDAVAEGEMQIQEWSVDTAIVQGKRRFQALKDIYHGPFDEALTYTGASGEHSNDEWN